MTEREFPADARARRAHGRSGDLHVDPDVDSRPEASARQPGDTNLAGRWFDIHPQVTFWAVGFLLAFIAWTLLFPERAATGFGAALAFVSDKFGWFYIVAANLFVLATAYFAFSRFGKIRIGGPDARPEFSTGAWYAMLMSAGMGIGLMFWSVAEPVSHLVEPAPVFNVAPETALAGKAALATTFFHWGLHPWAIYGLVSLALAFFAYNRGLPLTFRSVFHPLLGERIYGVWGHAIDVLSVLATLFGLATSLGLGVGQAAAGLNYLFGWPATTGFQVALIAGITGLATLSVAVGLHAGVRRLSQLNVWLAAALLLFVLVAGPTLFLLATFSQSLGYYVQVLPELAWWTEAFTDTDWQGGWTIFYWGWWISWSPFVGMFIARISKGRSVREMVVGVVAAPTLLSFLWLSVFGGAALNRQLGGAKDLAGAVENDMATAMFAMLETFPLAEAASLLGVVLVISFFVTSSDSGSLVVDYLTAGGKLDAPRPQRVFWAVMEGAVAAVLLVGGGLTALQTASVAAGLPFAVVLLVACFSLRRAFHRELDLLEEDYDRERFRERHPELMKRLDGGERP